MVQIGLKKQHSHCCDKVKEAQKFIAETYSGENIAKTPEIRQILLKRAQLFLIILIMIEINILRKGETVFQQLTHRDPADLPQHDKDLLAANSKYLEGIFYFNLTLRVFLFLLSCKWREAASLIFYTYLIDFTLLNFLPFFESDSKEFFMRSRDVMAIISYVLISAVDGKKSFWFSTACLTLCRAVVVPYTKG